MKTRTALLNLGCGSDCHPAYVNIDLFPGEGGIRHDVRQGLPFADGSFDLVYQGTLLNSLSPEEASGLVLECRRVLKPGGVLRVVEVDLEQMSRVYLQKLESACRGEAEGAREHEWMLLELYDQPTRDRPGGRMAQYVSRNPLPTEAFIYSRVGVQGRRMVAARRSRPRTGATGAVSETFLTRLRASIRRFFLTALLGPTGPQALDIGRFRLSSGQVTLRYYDRFSLKQLLIGAGFAEIALRTPAESAYPLWNTVNLDLTPEGDAARPHTLIMEGRRL